jgi:hypothetical protein
MGVREKKRRAIKEMKTSRKKADRVLDRTVLVPTKQVYDQESSSIIRALSRFFRGKTREALRPPIVSRAAEFLAKRIPQAERGLGGVLSSVVRNTMIEGIQASAALLHRVRKTGSPLDDLATVGKIVSSRQNRLEIMRRRSAVSLTQHLNKQVVDRLLSMPLEGAKVSDLITETGEKLDQEWWQVERTVRTETSFAYNQAQADGAKYLATEPEFRGLYSRWTELIDDLSGRPFDAAVAQDSMVLHGQLALPGRSFTMPSDSRAPTKMIGKSWSHPPNRPNDRAVLTPWMADWGVPGWIYRGGRRIRL